MGFFSQDCEGCGHPALSHHVTTPLNDWMRECVTIQPNGKVIIGFYDGYGTLNDGEGEHEYAIGNYDPEAGEMYDGATVYHRACWEVAGRPTAYAGPSRDSEDQGFFFDDADHAMPDPRLTRR